MGQKTNPIGLRLGITRGWDSVWFARGRKYAEFLEEDARLRRYIRERLDRAQISRIEIERKPQEVQVTIHTARAGLVIGSRGSTIDRLTRELAVVTGGKTVRTKAEEVRNPELDANLVADSVVRQIEGRVSVRRAMKRAMQDAIRSGAQGMKITCSGRLGGAEMSRTNTYHDGRVPLHTLRADIDFARGVARTTYGAIGVKVWVFSGENQERSGFAGSDQ
ncbi:30S ribosomal protein S3 [Candidatus Fermentibacterales bacterium]|nr:30S ribosomal protein S3 [Candidatus Fermentibacterales bacterium]